ncbi:MAG: sigma 54-interacting transcriptional regulator [Polyangiales bacterium]
MEIRRSRPPEGEEQVRAFFVIRHGERTWVVDLERDTPMDIGRSQDAPIWIDAEDVALVHAQVTWDGGRIVLRPVNARAPSFINGKRLEEATELVPGDEVAMGTVQLVVGVAAPTTAGGRRALTHQEFRERLWEEMARAFRGGRPTALVMVHAKAGEGGRVADTALRAFRAGDVVGTYAHDELEFLLPDTSREMAGIVVGRVLAQSGVPAIAGLAVAPVDGDNPERLLLAARKALESARRSSRGVVVPPPLYVSNRAPTTVDHHSRALVESLEAMATRDASLLLSGEIGTGKGVLARFVHDASQRSSESFIVIRCARLIDDERARAAAHEAIEAVERIARHDPRGATLLLYDVCDLPPSGQDVLLAWLEGTPPPLRLLATTSRDLRLLIERGTFREALHTRVSAEVFEVPPLRHRPEDIIPIAREFAEEYEEGASERLGMGALARLQSYPWPGNVLELRNAMERAVRLASGGEILAEHLPSETLPTLSGEGRLREHVDTVERDAIIKALADSNHNQTHAAKRLGISRRALIYKLEKYGLKPPAGTVRKRNSSPGD